MVVPTLQPSPPSSTQAWHGSLEAHLFPHIGSSQLIGQKSLVSFRSPSVVTWLVHALGYAPLFCPVAMVYRNVSSRPSDRIGTLAPLALYRDLWGTPPLPLSSTTPTCLLHPAPVFFCPFPEPLSPTCLCASPPGRPLILVFTLFFPRRTSYCWAFLVPFFLARKRSQPFVQTVRGDPAFRAPPVIIWGQWEFWTPPPPYLVEANYPPPFSCRIET